jgi:hypothetical protein
MTRGVIQSGSIRGGLPVITVEPGGVVKGDGEEPGVGVDGDERKPVAAVHAVAREVDPQRRLRQLRGHFIRRQRHLPRLVRVAVQAQVLLLCSTPQTPEAGKSNHMRGWIKRNKGDRVGNRGVRDSPGSHCA